ncbi:MAG TPA: hypothetical protein V6D02_01120 [Candidatus Obscuribacterales bacterium]
MDDFAWGGRHRDVSLLLSIAAGLPLKPGLDPIIILKNRAAAIALEIFVARSPRRQIIANPG